MLKIHARADDYRNFVLQRIVSPPHFSEIRSNVQNINSLLLDLSVGDMQTLGYNRKGLKSLTEKATDSIINLAALNTRDYILHNVIGLQGEAIELLIEEDPFEELGDVCYYIHAIAYFLNIPVKDIVDSYHDYQEETFEPENIRPLVGVIEVLANRCKKKFIYGQDIDDLPQKVLSVTSLLSRTTNIVDLMDSNEAKLSKRYKDKFTTQQSIERADKCED